MSVSDPLYPFPLFRFHVQFRRRTGDLIELVHGAFSECTGLEATMEPKVIKAGGSNYGAFQRPGPVTFATVILKRGITSSRDLWKWFSHVNERDKYAFRLDVEILVFGEVNLPPENLKPAASPTPQLTVKLFRALPVKFKCGDLNARATEVGIEELHLAHEGLTFEERRA
ncbi:MAG TPA: phage tail protein [Terriglobia bacterium]|nr:phage tail protein [Terriglobia bacterium]